MSYKTFYVYCPNCLTRLEKKYDNEQSQFLKHLLSLLIYYSAFLLFKNFMATFYGWGSTASRLEPLRGGSLLFTTKFPEISGTHFTDLGRMKG